MELEMLSPAVSEKYKNVENDSESSLMTSSLKSNSFIEKSGSKGKSDTSKSYDGDFKNIGQKWDVQVRKSQEFFISGNLFTENVKFFTGTENQVNEVSAKSESSFSNENTKILASYSPPQILSFQVKLSQKESCVIFDRIFTNSFEQIHGSQKYLEGFYKPRNRKIKKQHMNLMQRRLLAADDKKWVNSYGNMECSDNIVTSSSIRLDKNKEIVTNYKPPVLVEKCDEVVVIKENILEIHLQQLKFTYHPLFSSEHILVEKLCTLYHEYTSFIKGNNVGRIRTQLEALRYFRKNLENKKGVKKHGLPEIKNVYKDIQKVRKMYFDEAKRERDNLKEILSTWKEIKNIREKQNFSNTSVKLSIKKEKVDYEADNLRYNTEFDQTFQEMIKETEIDLQQTPKISKDKPIDEDTDEDDFDVDKENLKQYLENLFQQSFRHPGEPILKLQLSNSHEITKIIEHKKEITRRNNVKSTKLYLNVLCDKVAVCKSKLIELNESFILNLKETFSIQLEHMPKCLTIEIIEENPVVNKKICEIALTIPTQNCSYAQSKPIKSTFGTNEIVSNTNIQTEKETTSVKKSSRDKNSTTTKVTPAGYLEYYIHWQKTPLIKKDALREQIKLLKDAVKKDLTINVNKLSEWMVQSIPDPQDPRNVIFFEYMASNDLKLLNNKNNFRLSPITQSLEFCKIMDIEKNVRFKIIQLRNQNETEFDGIMVPNRIKEIPNNILDITRKRKFTENKYLFEEDAECEIEDQINYGRKYLKHIHEKLFQICKNYEYNLTYESVVDEKYLMHFEIMVKTFLRNFFNWFSWQPSKPLLAVPNIVRKPLDHQKMSKQCNVIIKIMLAKHIPKRKKLSKKPSSSEIDSSKTEYNTNEVKPFVEISYNNVSIRTSTSTGESPIWNETLTFPLECHNSDYLNSESLKGSITVNLYDEYDCNYTGKPQKKTCHNWLGAVDIPLSAICYSTPMSGLFKVKLAQLLLGYDMDTDEHIPKSPKINTSQCISQYTYIQMELSIIPNVPKLIMNMETLPCADLPYIQQHILKWNQNYNNNFPHRKFWALAVDTSVKTVCITRYLKPLEPPQINLEEFDVTAEQCLRYVSLIPFTDSNQFFDNVWLTTNELLQFMMGSVTDHAIALTCYLLALKMEAWLLLGYGIPHGSAAYVLVREYLRDSDMPTYYIYDVYYNEKYNLTDPYCPLKRIYCLANGENIWANIQRTDFVNITKFDLNKKSDWLPLFSNNLSAPTHFVNNKVIYRSKIKTEHLENHIETKIKNKISKLRQLDRTIWNSNLASDLKNILRSFEISSMYNRNNHETIIELNKKFSSYHVNGYVLNFPYLNTTTLVKNIKRMGIENQESNEFVLTVYIHTYTGPLISIWIFIGNVIKNIDI